jgi:hypothetical protein
VKLEEAEAHAEELNKVMEEEDEKKAHLDADTSQKESDLKQSQAALTTAQAKYSTDTKEAEEFKKAMDFKMEAAANEGMTQEDKDAIAANMKAKEDRKLAQEAEVAAQEATKNAENARTQAILDHEKEIDDHRIATDTWSSAEQQMNTATSDSNKASTDASNADTSLKNAREAKDAAVTTHQTTVNTLSKAKADLEEYKDKMSDLEDKVAELERDRDHQVELKATADTELAVSKTASSAYTSDVNDHELDQDDLREELKDAQNEVTTQETNLDALKEMQRIAKEQANEEADQNVMDNGGSDMETVVMLGE